MAACLNSKTARSPPPDSTNQGRFIRQRAMISAAKDSAPFLRFSDPSLETAFLREKREQSLLFIRTLAAVAAVLMLAFLWQDDELSPTGYIASNFRIYLGLPLCGIVFWLVGKPAVAPWIEPLTAFFFVAYTAVTAAIQLVFEPGPHGLSGIDGLGVMILLIIAAGSFSNLRFYWALPLQVCIFAIYALSVWLWTSIDYQEFLLGPFSVLMMGLIVTAAHSVVIERLQRKNFLAHAELVTEKDRYRNLLYTLVPSTIASRIEEGEFPIADSQAEMAILFADLAGFTEMTQKVAPRMLVQFLNELFSTFDSIASECRVEKIKTIGDGYMACCGPPVHEDVRTRSMIVFAYRVIEATREIARKYDVSVGIRIGVHTGSLIAGVIGRSRYSYDMWGESVNLASRMESSGMTNRIHISDSSYKRIRDHVPCELRGEISVKGVGVVQSYLVKEDWRPE